MRSSGHTRDGDLAPVAQAVGCMSTLRRPGPTSSSLSRVKQALVGAADQCRCRHLDNAHDVIAARFCAATQAGELTRSCICHAGPTFHFVPPELDLEAARQ
jgi:hypothetical protein